MHISDAGRAWPNSRLNFGLPMWTAILVRLTAILPLPIPRQPRKLTPTHRMGLRVYQAFRFVTTTF